MKKLLLSLLILSFAGFLNAVELDLEDRSKCLAHHIRILHQQQPLTQEQFDVIFNALKQMDVDGDMTEEEIRKGLDGYDITELQYPGEDGKVLTKISYEKTPDDELAELDELCGSVTLTMEEAIDQFVALLPEFVALAEKDEL